jgi:hypothetical protein
MVAVPRPIEDPPLEGEVLPVATGGSYLATVAASLTEQVRTLPQSADDLQKDFGLEFYDQIALDPNVSAAERILITAALNQGVQYVIPTPRTDPQYDRAARLQAFTREAFNRLPVALESLVYEMATEARQHGHKLAEAVWTTAKILPNYGPQLIYADIKPKPLTVYAFVQDAYANTLGITPRAPLSGRGVVREGRLDGQPIYPLTKFPVLTWNGRNRDPRGRSAFRPIYGAWWKKRQTEPGVLAYLARFGQPSLMMTLPPNAPDTVTVDGAEYKTADLYKAAGLEYQSGGVLIIPAGALAALAEAKGDGAAYIATEHLWNQEISVGLTGQTLATGEGTHRSGTDASTHQDMLGLLVSFLKAWIGDWITRQLIAPLIVANFGAAALPLAPRADLGRISPEDLAGLVNAIAQLAGQGYWDATRVPPDIGAELDTRIGFPQRQTTAIGPGGAPADQPPANPNPPQADAQPQPQGGAV